LAVRKQMSCQNSREANSSRRVTKNPRTFRKLLAPGYCDISYLTRHSRPAVPPVKQFPISTAENHCGRRQIEPPRQPPESTLAVAGSRTCQPRSNTHWTARRFSSALLFRLSFCLVFSRWVSTVFGLRCNRGGDLLDGQALADHLENSSSRLERLCTGSSCVAPPATTRAAAGWSSAD